MKALGQPAGTFSSPDPVGGFGWNDMAGVADDHPAVAGPTTGGYSVDTGLVHMGTGEATRSNWSEIYNLSSPIPWLLLLSIAYFGLVNLSVSAKIGR